MEDLEENKNPFLSYITRRLGYPSEILETNVLVNGSSRETTNNLF